MFTYIRPRHFFLVVIFTLLVVIDDVKIIVEILYFPLFSLFSFLSAVLSSYVQRLSIIEMQPVSNHPELRNEENERNAKFLEEGELVVNTIVNH